MLTRHFFKSLLVFTSMIILGLIGVSYVLSMDDKDTGGPYVGDCQKGPC